MLKTRSVSPTQTSAQLLFSFPRVQGPFVGFISSLIFSFVGNLPLRLNLSHPFKKERRNLKKVLAPVNLRAIMPPMKVLIDIEDDDGELLDALAKEQDRSRSAQARHMLTRAIREAAETQPEEATV